MRESLAARSSPGLLGTHSLYRTFSSFHRYFLRFALYLPVNGRYFGRNGQTYRRNSHIAFCLTEKRSPVPWDAMPLHLDEGGTCGIANLSMPSLCPSCSSSLSSRGKSRGSQDTPKTCSMFRSGQMKMKGGAAHCSDGIIQAACLPPHGGTHKSCLAALRYGWQSQRPASFSQVGLPLDSYHLCSYSIRSSY